MSKENYYPPSSQQPNVSYQPAALQNPIIIQQPGPVVMTTAVTSQVIGAPMRGWSSGLCDCCSDMKSCMCAFCFGSFYYASISTRMGENCCVGCSGYSYGCVPGGHLAMRAKFRASHGIQGSICDDHYVMNCLCLPCAMCQLSREMDKLGYSPNC